MLASSPAATAPDYFACRNNEVRGAVILTKGGLK
jgi:hypothetical protein